MSSSRLDLAEPGACSDVIVSFVAALARLGGLDDGRAYRLRLAADEITTNIVTHGYGGPGSICIEGRVEPACVRVAIVDGAVPFDPRAGDSGPAADGDLSHRVEGGLGLFLALRGLDGFDYDHSDGRNRNTLVMNRPETADGALDDGALDDGALDDGAARATAVAAP